MGKATGFNGRTYSRTIQKAYEYIEENGPSEPHVIHKYLVTRKRFYNDRTAQDTASSCSKMSQIMRMSPVFRYEGGLFFTKPLEEVARKWMSYAHPVKPFHRLPKILQDEIRRLEAIE